MNTAADVHRRACGASCPKCANRCPVCHRRVYPTAAELVSRHRDKTDRHYCPASGQPWRITTAV